MSQISARREAGSLAARQHWLAERLLDRTGLRTTHLRPTFFAEWLTTWWDRREIARVMSGALGIPVHYEPISVEEFASAMTRRGLAAHPVQHLSNVAVDYRNGVFADTNDVVEQVGGRAPLSVEQFVVERKAGFETSGPNFVPAP
jgi:NAD(P)H dehydrogenase (quinone)